MATPLSVHQPTTDVRGGVVVVQEAFGVNEHIEDVCARLAEQGWLAVAPHLFHRDGDPVFGYDEISAAMPQMRKLSADGILDDVDVAIAHLAEHGVAAKATGIVGFCMGGTVALHVGASRDIGAAVTFYGGGVTSGRFGFPAMCTAAPSLRVPWLGLFGDRDTSIKVDDVEQLRIAAASSATVTEVVRYSDAGHGFNCDRRDSYHEASAIDAWSRTLDWFADNLSQ